MNRLLMFIGVPWTAWLAALMSLMIAGSPCDERVAVVVSLSRERIAVTAAWAAFAVGAAYAAVSVYWGLGGTALLDTVGGALERQAASGSATSIILVWGAAALKLAVAVLPLAAIRLARSSSSRRCTRALGWSAGTILIAYGFVLTAVGVLIETGVVRASRHADHRALAWHAFLWDPWFLCWGVLVTVAMVVSRNGKRAEVDSRGRARASNASPPFA